MVGLHLLLAHLLGDFVFQSNDLIQRKYRSWIGTFEHVCIVGFFTALFLFPFLTEFKTWLLVVIVFSVHFFQDILKTKFDLHFNLKRKSVWPFFLDQALHISLLLYLASKFDNFPLPDFSPWILNIYFSKFLIAYLLGLVFFSYTYDLIAYQFKRQKSKKPLFYSPNFKDMSSRLTWFSLISVTCLLLYRGCMEINVILLLGGKL
ncbi:MAG: DUF3307 domain-containing protein [Candidatus Gracilibacteria bacterium]|jgi:hypothetical protein